MKSRGIIYRDKDGLTCFAWNKITLLRFNRCLIEISPASVITVAAKNALNRIFSKYSLDVRLALFRGDVYIVFEDFVVRHNDSYINIETGKC